METNNQYKESPGERRIMARKYSDKMLIGLAFLVAGAFLTVVGYSVREACGLYFIFWGAIVYGLYDFVRGLVGWLEYREKGPFHPNFCPDCGKELSQTDDVCPSCGTRIDEFLKAKKRYLCPSCKARLISKQKYCSWCGTKLKWSSS